MSHIPTLQNGQQGLRSRNCRRYRRKLIKGLAVLALLLVAASGAEAQQTYPGSTCVQQGFPVFELFGESLVKKEVNYLSRGDVCNNSNIPLTV
jgi:hypothetical protein